MNINAMRLAPLSAMLLFAGCAEDLDSWNDDQLGSEQQEIVRGHSSSGYPAVAALYADIPGSIYKIFSCTGTLVEPDVILTAAHCTGITEARFRNGGVYPVVDDVAHPNYRLDNPDRAAYDVRVLVIDTSKGVAPPFPMGINRATPVPLSELTIVGYGTGDQGGPSRFREGTNDQWVLDEESYYYLLPTRDGAGVCSGDSGGPLLDDSGYVIGVTAGFTLPSCDLGESSFAAVTNGSVAGDWLFNGLVKRTSSGRAYLDHVEASQHRVPEHPTYTVVTGLQLVGDFDGDGCQDRITWELAAGAERADLVRGCSRGSKSYYLHSRPTRFGRLQVDGQPGEEIVVMATDSVSVITDRTQSLRWVDTPGGVIQVLGVVDNMLIIKHDGHLTQLDPAGAPAYSQDIPYYSQLVGTANLIEDSRRELIFIADNRVFFTRGVRTSPHPSDNLFDLEYVRSFLLLRGIADVSGNGYDDLVFEHGGGITVDLGGSLYRTDEGDLKKAKFSDVDYGGNEPHVYAIEDVDNDGSKEVLFASTLGAYYAGSMKVSRSGYPTSRVTTYRDPFTVVGFGNLDTYPGVEMLTDVGVYNVTVNQALGFPQGEPGFGLEIPSTTFVVGDPGTIRLIGGLSVNPAYFTVTGVPEDADGRNLATLPIQGAIDTRENHYVGTFTWQPDPAHVGTHTIEFTQTRGNGAHASKTVTIEVVPKLACSVSHTATDIRWHIEGATSCTWSDNGTDRGSLACQDGTAPLSALSAGNHTVALSIHNGDRSASCSDSFTVPPPASCSISHTTTALSWRFSDATTCSWRDNGVSQGSVPCTSGSVPLTTFSAGNHTLQADVSGPGGSGSCSHTFTAPPPPACRITHSSTTMYWYVSNASSCTWSDNGVNKGSIACRNGSVALTAFSPGSHRVAMAASGGGSTATCSDSFSAPYPPSCSLRTSGGNLYWTIGHSTRCTWSDNGVNNGSIACSNGSAPLNVFSAGSHTVRLSVSGTGGSTSCSIRFTR